MTHEFERSLTNGIPQHEAADFLLRIKTAGWGDPPDETGALEGQFAAPLEQVISSLTLVIAAKFKLMMAYHIYAESMRGVAQHAIGDVFHEHAAQEQAAADAYLKRAAVLGSGPVHVPEVETPPASSDPVGIIMLMARAEQEGIAAQAELKQLVGEVNPLAFQIEQYMVEDQHHLDELWQMLPQDVQRMPVIDTAQAGAPGAMPAEGEMPLPEEQLAPEQPVQEEPAPEEPPAEKKEAFARGLRKLAGMAEDLIGDMAPEDRKALMREEKLRGLVDAVPLQAKKLVSRAGEIAQPLVSPSGKRLLGGGVSLGALLGASRGASMGKREERELRAGGPISRFKADHPISVGAGMGAASLGGAMAGGLMAPRGVSLLGGIAGSMAPGAVVSVLDKGLKRREDKLKTAFAVGLRKLGFAPPEPGFGTDPGAAPAPTNQPMIAPQPSMAGPGVQPPMANPPGQAQYAPVNYLEAEETARRAQADNEAAFYRGQAQNATTQVQSMGAQVQQIQGQLDQLSAQAAESQSQILAANEEAVRANDQMLNQATLAARMRMGMQQLRAQMMEIASQDPEQLAAAAGGPTPMDVGNQAAMSQGGQPGAGGDPSMGGAPADPNAEPGAQPGAPGASPEPSTGGPSAAPGGSGGPSGSSSSSSEPKTDSEGSSAKKDGGETTVSIKKGSVKRASMQSELVGKLPYMAAGGALGAGAGYIEAKRGANIPSLRDRVDALKGEQDGGFAKSIELAKTQLALGQAEEARANPVRSALKGGLLGASVGGALRTAVPAAYHEGKDLLKHLKMAREPL